ncbi:MAG: hypothetical protein LBR87_04030 [Synergistaceae bacterium]|nr:hypothetical protein [Synergistaceae bacterium]
MKNFTRTETIRPLSSLLSRVTFHESSLLEKASVEAVLARDGLCTVITDVTPFHPRDYRWPDQPEDTGVMECGGRAFRLEDAVYVALSPEGEFFSDGDIPVKKDSPGWRYFAGHVISTDGAEIAPGKAVSLSVDEDRRKYLSRAHSASHLMGLALNRTLSRLWRKDPGNPDGLGFPNFDSMAMERSKIDLLSVTDKYHMGKSLRKKGFEKDELVSDPQSFGEKLNELVSAWLARPSPITIRAENYELTGRRFWSTTLGGVTAEIPCGGTHARGISDIGTVSCSLEIPDGETLIIRTTVR